VNVISPCPTFRGGMGIYKDLRQMLRVLSEDHDAASYDAAMQVARDADKLYAGVLYRRGGDARYTAPVQSRSAADSLELAENYR
jgi:hypothetical protein